MESPSKTGMLLAVLLLAGGGFAVRSLAFRSSCEVLGESGDSCLGDMVVMANNSVMRVSLEKRPYDRAPQEVAALLESHEALAVIDKKQPDYHARLFAQYQSQMQSAARE